MTRLDNLLSKYSSKLGLDLNYFMKNGFWLSLDQGFNLVKYFVLSILFANFISKEVYGQYNFVMSIIGIGIIFTLPNLIPSVIQSISKKKDGIYNIALRKTMLFSLLGSIFMLGTAIFCHLTGRIYAEKIFLFLVFLFPLYYSSSYYSILYQGKEKFKKLAILNIIFTIVSLILLTLVIYFKKDLFSIVITTILVKIIIQSYYTFYYAKKELTNKNYDEKNLEFGKKTNISNGFATITTHLDSLLIPFFLGFEALAIYSIVTLLPNQIKISFNSLNPLFLPKLSKKEINKRELTKHLIKFILISIICIIGYIIISPYVFNIFYAPYAEYVSLSILFSISLIILPYNFLLANIQSKLDEKKINKISYSNSVILIFSTIIGIQFGLIGLIIGRIIHRILVLLIIIKYNYD